MAKFHSALAACCGAVAAIAALTSTADARGGGGFGGHGGFSGSFGNHGSFGGDNGFGRNGRAYGPIDPERGAGNRPSGPGGYGPVPGRRNPYAMGAVPFINMDYNDLLQTPPNNSGSSLPNDCNYLYGRAVESGTPEMWRLFNDCAHNR